MTSKKARRKHVKVKESGLNDGMRARLVAHMTALNETSKQLHAKAIADGAVNTLDPVHWLMNEDTMRFVFEKVFCPVDPMLRLAACHPNNSLYAYMKFMCESYPPGFGNACKRAFHENTVFDGAEMFQRLGGRIV
jgi:hypothetical protein